MPHQPAGHDARPLRERLQQALGDAYLIERELGGGMSRVFAARERQLDRLVVVKVLPPELGAGVNTERFQREIGLAARLQHPHVVALHTAGEIEGLPYYPMPYIEGESLRQRMQGGPLPIADAVRVLHDVADALAYAHGQGVVHRDIKPDNILLTRGHAVVTDFGVAKAISLANATGSREAPASDGHGVAHRTVGGLAIGTPAYMAPEQAAGDPDTDHRADIYALGVVAWEMLAGRTIFGRRPAHELLAAQITEQPAPIDEVRPDVPRALAELVMRCLEKHPDQRPADAGVMRDVLAGISGSLSAASGGRLAFARRGTRGPLVGALAATLVAVAAAAYFLWPKPAAVDDALVAVVPFHVSGDPALRYLREGMLDLLAAKLTGEGGPRSADPRAVLGAWRRETGSDTSDLTRERMLALAERLGAGQLLLGDIGGDAGRVVLNASLVNVRDGRVAAQASVLGSVDSLPYLVDRLTGQLLALRAGEADRLPMLSSTSLPALRSYLSGQWLYRRGRYREAAHEYTRALDGDSSFTMAALGLVDATGWTGDMMTRQRASKLAWDRRDSLPPRERARLLAAVGPRFPQPSPYREMLDAGEAYARLAADRPDAVFSYGDQLFHTGWAVGMRDAHDRAAALFRQSLALDSTFAPALEHLVLIEARRGDTAAAERAADRFLALDSLSESAEGIRWRMAALRGDRAAMEEITRRGIALRPTSIQYVYGISLSEGVAPDLAERVVEAAYRDSDGPARASHAFAAHGLALTRGQPRRASDLLRRFVRDTKSPFAQPMLLREQIKDALYWDGDTLIATRAAVELARATGEEVPLEAQRVPTYLANLCTLERWRLAHGDGRTARRSIAALRSPAARRSGFAELSIACALTMDAQLAVLEGAPDAEVRIARLDSMLVTGPANATQDIGNLVVAQLKERTGDVPGALDAVRRRDYMFSRGAYLSTYLREEARLAERVGDVDGAITAWRQYLALRDAPEPSVEPDLDAARAALARLEQSGSNDR